MRKEIEVKAKIGDADSLIATLTASGCIFSDPIIQEDRVFLPAGVSLPVALGTNVLRIRNSNGKIVFTFKRPLSNGLDKLEHEVIVDDAKELENILTALDFHEVSLVKKIRRKTNYKDYEICIDVVDVLGSFIEMEKIAEDVDSAAVQEEMFAVLLSFGVKKEDRVLVGYDVLMHDYEQSSQKSVEKP